MPWSALAQSGANSTVLYVGDDVVLGRFRCLPDDPLWRTENVVAQGDLVAFPTTCVLLSRGREQIVADRNRAVVYADGQTYRRELVHPAGDHCTFLRLSPRLTTEIAGLGLDSAGWRSVATTDATYAALRLVVTDVSESTHLTLSRAEVEEELLGIVAATCAGPPDDARAATPAWRDLADGVRLALDAQPPSVRFSLAGTARDVGYSAFHMSRVFRAVTGSSVHGYAERLRLRHALDRVVDGERDLSALAVELGFASHSHFTVRFRRAFGGPPSALRNRRRAGWTPYDVPMP